MIKQIIIDVIPHCEQRYNTVGDWQFERSESGLPTVLKIKVSQMSWHDDYAYLVAVHELVEAILCEKHGISEKKVDEFDLNWKPNDYFHEPGEDPAAPYHREHTIASIVERLLCERMYTNWASYERYLNSLVNEREVRTALGLVEQPSSSASGELGPSISLPYDDDISPPLDDDIPF